MPQLNDLLESNNRFGRREIVSQVAFSASSSAETLVVDERVASPRSVFVEEKLATLRSRAMHLLNGRRDS